MIPSTGTPQRVVWILFSLLFFVVTPVLAAEDIVLCDKKLSYSLQGEGYKTQKIVSNGFEILVVKFPGIPSSLLQTTVIPNFAITTEKVPKETTTMNYLQFKLGQFQSMSGFNKAPSHDDILSCGLGECINLYFEYRDGGGSLHSNYVVVKVLDGVGFCITFDF